MSRNSFKRASFKNPFAQEHIKFADLEHDQDSSRALSPRMGLANVNQSLNSSTKIERKNKKKTYALKRTVQRLFLLFSFLITMITTTYTLVGLLYYDQLKWVILAFDEGVFVNIDIMAQVGAAENKDFLSQSLTDLKIAKDFMTQIMDSDQQNPEFLESRYSDVTLRQSQIKPDFKSAPAGCIFEEIIVDNSSVQGEADTFLTHL